MLTTGMTLELTVEKPVAGGRMLARHDGQVVLVAGAIPGERVRARIDRVHRGLGFAQTTDVLEPSPSRRAPADDPLCGGNVYAHVAYAEQAAIKRAVLQDALRHGGRIEWPAEDLRVTSSPEQGYRMRARLHVRRGRVGFFREGTHDLCDCDGTGQLLPAAIAAVRAFVDATPRHVRDAIDAIELTESLTDDERVLHVLWAPHARVPRGSLAELWPIEQLPGITGVSCDDPSTGRARTVAGRAWVSDPIAVLIAKTLGDDAQAGHEAQRDGAGTETVRKAGGSDVAVAAATLQRHATSFFQANRYLLPDLVAAVHRVVLPDAPVIDLYAGVGLFAITLAARGWTSVVAVEGDPSSVRDLVENAKPFADRLHVEHAPVESYLERSLSRAALASSATPPSSFTSPAAPSPASAASATPSSVSLPSAATLIVDPPRTGMTRQALDGVLRAGVARIVYVSCDVATLSRDLRRLLDAGYRLDHIEAFDLFPNTAHVESLAVLSK